MITVSNDMMGNILIINTGFNQFYGTISLIRKVKTSISFNVKNKIHCRYKRIVLLKSININGN